MDLRGSGNEFQRVGAKKEKDLRLAHKRRGGTDRKFLLSERRLREDLYGIRRSDK